MVLDSSALLAVLLAEADADRFMRAIASDETRLVGTVSFLETSLVLMSRKGPSALGELDLLVDRGRMKLVSLDEEQAVLAREASERFGKGRHPAGLNLGDCCSYALARQTGEPLLSKGDDFSRTDIRSALA